MRAFGIIMALFGCGIAFIGLVHISDGDATPPWTCQPGTSPQETYCSYRSSDFGTDPSTAERESSLGLAAAVIGAAFIAGGLACAGAGGGGGKKGTGSFAPPVGGQAYAGAAGSPPPAYGQQTQQQQPQSRPQPWGTEQQ